MTDPASLKRIRADGLEPSAAICVIDGLPLERLSDIASLAQRISGFDEAFVRQHLHGRRNILTCLAEVNGQLAGYKIGYEDRPAYFESWIGAVAPEFRRRGIATALLERQHEWCRARGFHIVSTVTEGANQAMLIANLRAGFEICGTYFDRRKVLKVMLQKHLKDN